jgi:putative thiamine transport system ATP-binding protein
VSRPLLLRGVEIALGSRRLVPRLELEVPPGSATTVMGPSGAGKSSLLAFVGGFLDAAFSARGEVWIGGAEVTRWPAERRRAGILFQDDLLFPHLSVGGNLAFGLTPRIGRRAERRRAVEAALDRAGLGGFHDRDPATLSGGQRARVAVLRTLLAEPQALLLDEPFSRLDTELRQEFRRFVFDHARERDLPMLLVTHDLADAEAAGGPVIALAAP